MPPRVDGWLDDISFIIQNRRLRRPRIPAQQPNFCRVYPMLREGVTNPLRDEPDVPARVVGSFLGRSIFELEREVVDVSPCIEPRIRNHVYLFLLILV